jgi:hypothetical protein
MSASLEFIDLGSVVAFKRRLAALQGRVVDRIFRFSKMEKHAGFWLFEDEDDDEIVGGVLHVKGGRVYAISKDVEKLVGESFAKV